MIDAVRASRRASIESSDKRQANTGGSVSAAYQQRDERLKPMSQAKSIDEKSRDQRSRTHSFKKPTSLSSRSGSDFQSSFPLKKSSAALRVGKFTISEKRRAIQSSFGIKVVVMVGFVK
jgi:hypothetical protein